MRVAFNFSDLVREYSHRDLLLGLLLVKLLPKGTCLYLELRAVLRGMSLWWYDRYRVSTFFPIFCCWHLQQSSEGLLGRDRTLCERLDLLVDSTLLSEIWTIASKQGWLLELQGLVVRIDRWLALESELISVVSFINRDNAGLHADLLNSIENAPDDLFIDRSQLLSSRRRCRWLLLHWVALYH